MREKMMWIEEKQIKNKKQSYDIVWTHESRGKNDVGRKRIAAD